VFMEPKGS